MTCYHPGKAFLTGRLTENGAKEYYVTFHPGDFVPAEEVSKRFEHSLQHNEHTRTIGGRLCLVDYVPIPCGKCIGCRLDYSRRWAVRCCLEASYHEESYFITLTYNDENLPLSRQPSKEDLQLFHKRLRKRISKFRYFACGELGESTKRPHYHAIYFGLHLDDLKVKYIQDGVTYYISETLSNVWGKGNVLIGDCTFKSCAYVARYCMKKIGDGSSFVLMSRKPGLGLLYFNEHFKDIYETDQIYFNFGDFNKCKPPRYFDKKLKEFDPHRLEFLSELRTQCANKTIANYSHAFGLSKPYVLEHKEFVKRDQIRRLKRKL